MTRLMELRKAALPNSEWRFKRLLPLGMVNQTYMAINAVEELEYLQDQFLDPDSSTMSPDWKITLHSQKLGEKATTIPLVRKGI